MYFHLHLYFKSEVWGRNWNRRTGGAGVEDRFQEELFNDNRYFSNPKPGPGEVELLRGCSFKSWRVS